MIFKATFKITYFILAVLGAYYLYSTNFQPTDFFRDTKRVVENNFGVVDTEQIKKQAVEKISNIVNDNKDLAKEVVEEKIKEAVNETVEQVKDKLTATSTVESEINKSEKNINSIGKISACKKGYYFSEIFVAVCIQNDCEKISGAKLNEDGRCECKDEGLEFYRGIDFKECPGCLFECKN